MISPSWKSLRRAKTKKITTIGRNKVFNSLRARRVERTAATGHPFDPSFLLVLSFSFDKGTKCLNRLADVYHNFLRASRILLLLLLLLSWQSRRRVTWREAPRLSLVLSGYTLRVFNVSRDHPLPVRSFDDNGNESKSTMMMMIMMTYSNVSPKDWLASTLKKNQRNAIMILLLLLLLLLLLNRLALRPAEKYGSHADGDVRIGMRDT